MGQYHRIYNITKKEYFEPHDTGDGAKLTEWGWGGVYTMAIAVLLCNSNGRGFGDFHCQRTVKDDDSPVMADIKRENNRRVAEIEGRWAGDNIVVQGDAAEPGDTAFIDEQTLETEYTDISDLVMAGMHASSEVIMRNR